MSRRNSGRGAVVRAAGALVWRERGGRLEVALVHRPHHKDWSWPKGKLDPGESLPAAAAREVAEETGSAVVLGVPLPGLRYSLPDGRTKQVHYWAARVATDDDAAALRARAPVDRAAPTEIDDVVWVGVRAAHDLLTRRTDRAPLSALADLWDRDRLRTRALLVVRHGQAVPRAGWDGDEGSRPLTGTGREQSAALVQAVAAFGAGQVVSSPWERCRGTVQPYLAATGLPVRTVDALQEEAHGAAPGTTRAVLDEQLQAGRDVLLSTHRKVLPTVVATLRGMSRPWTTGRLPGKDPYLRTGEALVAHVALRRGRPRVVALERHRPSTDAD